MLSVQTVDFAFIMYITDYLYAFSHQIKNHGNKWAVSPSLKYQIMSPHSWISLFLYLLYMVKRETCTDNSNPQNSPNSHIFNIKSFKFVHADHKHGELHMRTCNCSKRRKVNLVQLVYSGYFVCGGGRLALLKKWGMILKWVNPS